MRDFSQELVDLLIDLVSEATEDDDITSAAICGLVCKTWLPRSRFHVFRRVRLDGFRLASLLDIAGNSSLELLSLTRRVWITFRMDYFDPGHMAKLRECVNLTCVRVSTPLDVLDLQADWTVFLEKTLPLLGLHCPILSRLEINPGTLRVSLRTIVDMFACLPSLQAFKLDGDSCAFLQEDIPSSLPFPAHFDTLDVIWGQRVGPLFAWFLSLPVLPKIKSLTLYDAHHREQASQERSLELYFQRGGNGFEYLDLWGERASDGPFGMLKYATALRHLKLHRQIASDVPNILASLKSSNLHTINIEIYLVMGDPDQIPYTLIDQALASPRLASVKRFYLEGLVKSECNYISPSVLSPEAKARMPLANARGILY
ncbi:hypothetical protein DFH09DRAFT_1121268 [Mycena vulgaris]|nr:hypothetical protein DFH09DRAFT_1121268 [Mycena vulgaris]